MTARTRTRARRKAPAKRTAGPSPSKRRIASPPAPSSDEGELTIVAVGASAGGLDAFVQLLEALPPDSGLALIVVQHLSPQQHSALPELLAAHTAMPVLEAANRMPVRANHVYVIPPNVQLEVRRDRLVVSPRPKDRRQHTPIDTLFASLAAAAGSRTIAVVLSGTASDGSLGLRDVKAAGGIAIAQTPASAKQDGMPRAAIATGMVDLVLTPAEIGVELGRIARHPYVPSAPHLRSAIVIRDDQLRRIFDLLRPVSGVDFRHYKLPTIRRRLLRRMALHRLTDIDAYLRLLQTTPEELRGLFEDLLIRVTRFFREPESFEALVREVFPKLTDGCPPERPIRVWVCGCATGEEAYSLGICLVEYLQQHQSDLRVHIFATDVSDTAIEHARAGIYPASIAPDVGTERLRRFFTRTDGSYRVSKLIRDLCVFAKQDLTRDPPFSRIDLVLCRNVLIYMDAMLQRKLVSLFHYALNPDGYLMLGQAETVGAHAALFTVTDKKHRIHRRKNAPGSLPASSFPPDYPAVESPRRRGPGAVGPELNLQTEVNRVLLDRYTPSGVVVDNDLQIVQFRGQTGPFLEPAPGEARLSLLKMVREGLLYGLRAALQTARKTRTPVRKAGLRVRAGDESVPVAIEVVPLVAMGRPHFLVLFERTADTAAEEPDTASRRTTRPKRSREDHGTTMLRRELAASREYLQSIIQELEAANEELQSANEEIISSNEELQSTNEELDTAKEELQSTNEELNTLNEELQSRNDEMRRVNSDLMNLVGSVQIAIVIVSSDLRIRRFTPMAEKVLNLIPSDLDRAIGHINPNIDCPNLEALIAECMDTVTLVEREVQDRQGKWYSLRIRPYKSLDNKIDGAVLALFDVDLLKRSEQRARLAEAHADALMNGANDPLALLDQALVVQRVSTAFGELIGVPAEELRGKPVGELDGHWPLDGWRGLTERPLGAALPPQTVRLDDARVMVLNGRFIPALDGEVPLILARLSAAAPRRR